MSEKKLEKETEEKQEARPVLIVGLGASAGGLDAFQQFFDHMPADSAT
jgi:two-component system CheB/CheR fusion protein